MILYCICVSLVQLVNWNSCNNINKIELCRLLRAAVAVSFLLKTQSSWKRWLGEGRHKMSTLLWCQCSVALFVPPASRNTRKLWKSLAEEGGASRIVRPRTEADFSDGAPIVCRSCVGWWGDLWLQMKSQSDLPFPELCVSQLFCTGFVAVQNAALSLINLLQKVYVVQFFFSFVQFMKRFKAPTPHFSLSTSQQLS